jgi:glutamate synthase domain-containing protein 1/formylmethanofuran dehydrogenase subunit C
MRGACGIFGVLSLDGKGIPFEDVLKGIEAVRFRGSRLGAGFALFKQGSPTEYRIKVFIREDLLKFVERTVELKEVKEFGSFPFRAVTFLKRSSNPEEILSLINELNEALWDGGRIKGRVISASPFLDMFKGIGYPMDVAEEWGLLDKELKAGLWLAHTRQPTNSPGIYPIWSHPFSCLNWAVVHNGDISSFGSNVNFLTYRGITSFVGTDSELVPFILDQLTRVEGLRVEEAAKVLINPYSFSSNPVSFRYRWASLDGPFSLVVGFSDGEDAYLLAMVDRSKFRPLVIGYDGNRVYAASEEHQIRRLSPDARVWHLRSGSFFLASKKRGIIAYGGSKDRYVEVKVKPDPKTDFIDAALYDYKGLYRKVGELFDSISTIRVINVQGHRYLGMGMVHGQRLIIYGYPGNCLANLNEGGMVEVYGNASDDVADTMHDGKVVIYGNAGDVVGQALQGGKVFIRGSAGNRIGIQMREYSDRRPWLVIGEGVGDYLAEYMAGGRVIVLGLGHEDEPVGNFVATGMIGGKVYVRGRLDYERVGLNPPEDEVRRYLVSLVKRGELDERLMFRFLDEGHSVYDLIHNLSGEALKRTSKVFLHGYFSPIKMRHSYLYEDEEAVSIVKEFFQTFGLSLNLLSEVLNSEFTIIEPSKLS